MKSIKEQATELLQRCEVVILTSINKDGYPRPVPMSKIYTENFSEIWMATGKNALKTNVGKIGLLSIFLKELRMTTIFC